MRWDALGSAEVRSGHALSSEASKEHLRKCSHLRKSIFGNAHSKQTFEKAFSKMLNTIKASKKAASKMLNSSKACVFGASWIRKFIEKPLVLQAFSKHTLGRLGSLLKRLKSILERLANVLERFWSILERLGSVSGASWAVLGSSWSVSGASWSVFGASWSDLGASWSVLEGPGTVFGSVSE